nr:MAG TPA: hypothetical protein [Bacteriophage sp.]
MGAPPPPPTLDSPPRGIAGYPPVISGFDLENWSRGLNAR